MNPLHDAIVARVPATMRELAAATGVDGQALWDAVATLRQAGIILRKGPHGDRSYVARAFVPLTQEQVAENPDEAAAKEKKQRKYPVILFYIENWPSQDPNRRMLWKICWGGGPKAEREIKGLKKRLSKKAKWELSLMTPTEARRLHNRMVGARALFAQLKKNESLQVGGNIPTEG